MKSMKPALAILGMAALAGCSTTPETVTSDEPYDLTDISRFELVTEIKRERAIPIQETRLHDTAGNSTTSIEVTKMVVESTGLYIDTKAPIAALRCIEQTKSITSFEEDREGFKYPVFGIYQRFIDCPEGNSADILPNLSIGESDQQSS